MKLPQISKKAMGISQVFVFIIAAVTFGLIMIFGYKAIAGFLESGEQVAFVQFKNDLESSVKKIHTEFGAVRNEVYEAPSKYENICFVNMDHAPSPDELQALCGESQIACTVWQSAHDPDLQKKGLGSVDENVFLDPIAPVKIKVHSIKIDEGNGPQFLCTKLHQGRARISLLGKGDHTSLLVTAGPEQ